MARDGTHRHVHGANLGVRADLLDAVGGWRRLHTGEDHDLWQRALLGVSQVGTDEAHVDRCLREVVRFIEALEVAELAEEKIEFLHYS